METQKCWAAIRKCASISFWKRDYCLHSLLSLWDSKQSQRLCWEKEIQSCELNQFSAWHTFPNQECYFCYCVTPIANQGCLSVPLSKGPSAALTGVVCHKYGFLFRDGTSPVSCKAPSWSITLLWAKWFSSPSAIWAIEQAVHVVHIIHPEPVPSPRAAESLLLLRGLSAVLSIYWMLLEAGQHYLLTAQTGNRSTAKLAWGGVDSWWGGIQACFFDPGLRAIDSLCVAFTLLWLANGNRQSTLAVLASKSLQGMSGCSLTK